jgi:hypothetical protein
LRECDGVRGDAGSCSSCFLDKLNLRFGAVDLVGGSGQEISVGETGVVPGVVEAMVPPTPAREALGTILSGAYLVMEQAVGGMIAAGATSVGL